MGLPTVFGIGVFHGLLDADRNSSCAFGMKNLKFPAHILPYGWRYVEFANAGSKSCAEEKVELLSEKEYAAFYPPVAASDFAGNRAVIGMHGWPLFHERLKRELTARAKPGDIVCHPFGRAHQEIVNLYPHLQHLESGIGYSDAPFGCWRIFESNGWRQWHWGRWESDPLLAKDKGQNRIYSWVINNSFVIEQWPYSPIEDNEDYVLYMGRIDACKGMTTIAELIRENAKQAQAGTTKLLRWIFAGQGNFQEAVMRHVIRDPAPLTINVEHIGVVNGKARAKLAGHARCLIAPTDFIEPFNGSHVEALLTGTGAVTSNFGAFCETFTQGLDGFRCHTLGDYLAAIEAVKSLDRAGISRRARERYSIEACGKQYDAALRQIADLSGAGWYTTKSHLIPLTSQPRSAIVSL